MHKLHLWASIFAATLMLLPTAEAVEVSKCVDKSGNVTFTDGPCPDAASKSSAGTFSRASSRPPPADADPQYEQQQIEGTLPIETAGVPMQSSAGQANGTAYRCQANNRTWIQTSPCPLTSERTVSVPINGTLVGTGEPISGRASQRVTTPVGQESLSKEQLCEQLNRRAAMSEHSKNGASDAYERNILRQKYGCY